MTGFYHRLLSYKRTTRAQNDEPSFVELPGVNFVASSSAESGNSPRGEEENVRQLRSVGSFDQTIFAIAGDSDKQISAARRKAALLKKSKMSTGTSRTGQTSASVTVPPATTATMPQELGIKELAHLL